jgi:glycosyltransferase involved in cell wall biosynthesis
MRIFLLSPFHTGSHATWAEGYRQHSHHTIDLLTLAGRHWKWRMHGAAITLARRLTSCPRPDLLLSTDMLDLATLRALLPRSWGGIPMVLYFHENQLTYPWSPTDPDRAQQRDRHYGFINYRSALAADAIWFNSTYHQQSFLAALRAFLEALPDHRELDLIATLQAKSRVMPLGLDLPDPPAARPVSSPPLLLWNHRWEYDKAPEAFFEVMFALQAEGYAFELAVLGESFGRKPPIFAEAKRRLSTRLRHWGYASRQSDYWQWLHRADLLPVTAVHDFFGASTVEAMAAGVFPLLPQRLAYPEHLPFSLQKDHLYHDEAELLARMRAWLAEPTGLSVAVRKHVQRYAWPRLAPRYDEELSELVAVK